MQRSKEDVTVCCSIFGANFSEQKPRYADEMKMMMPGRTAKTCREMCLNGLEAEIKVAVGMVSLKDRQGES